MKHRKIFFDLLEDLHTRLSPNNRTTTWFVYLYGHYVSSRCQSRVRGTVSRWHHFCTYSAISGNSLARYWCCWSIVLWHNPSSWRYFVSVIPTASF